MTGSYIKMIVHLDVGGLLPDFVKKSIGEAQYQSLNKILDYIKKEFNCWLIKQKNITFGANSYNSLK